MHTLFQPRPFTIEERAAAYATIVGQIRPNRDYYVLVIGAIGLALGAATTTGTA